MDWIWFWKGKKDGQKKGKKEGEREKKHKEKDMQIKQDNLYKEKELGRKK